MSDFALELRVKTGSAGPLGTDRNMAVRAYEIMFK
jgi:hypothetical protein